MQELKSKVRTAFKAYKRDNSAKSWDSYVILRREFKSKLSKSRKEAWRNFTAGVQGPKAASKLFKGLQSERKQNVELLATRNRSPMEAVESLMSTHFPGCVRSNCSDPTTAMNPLDLSTASTESDFSWNSDKVSFITKDSICLLYTSDAADE